MHLKQGFGLGCRFVFGCLVVPAFLTVQAQLLWTVGVDDNDWPQTSGGGPNAAFVQENGAINALPGSSFSTIAPQGADNDYYLTGIFDTVIPSNAEYYGDYSVFEFVFADEEAAERAFAGADNDLRYHFNLPDAMSPTDLLSVTFDIFNLHEGQPDTRYGIEVYVNSVLIQPEILIRPAQIDVDYTTRQFTLEEVNAVVGEGADNIVSLRGVNYNNAGGGNWMGLDYVQLNQETEVIPAATFPWAVGMDDDDWPTGDGGGPNATFVQEDGVQNLLPGVPNSPEVDQQADNDYYFGGSYTTVVTGNGDYTPVGTVSANEEAAERAFAGEDTDLRYHFNLPNELQPTDMLSVTFDAFNLDESAADPRYGVEVYFNGVLVQSEMIIRAAELNTPISTPAFTLADVNAMVGPGHDNIVTLRGISYSDQDGGGWMGIDYVKLDPVAPPIPDPVLPWTVGANDNAHTAGNGGGPNTTFVQEDGVANALPGNPNSPEVNQQADDDYYFAGVYATIIESNGSYEPVGSVHEHEEAAERAFAGEDNDLRYHFNLPADLEPNSQLAVSFEALDLDTSVFDPHYGVEVYFNGVLIQPEIVVRTENLNQTIVTPPFTLEEVNAQPGAGFDNIVTLKGINFSGEGGGGWMGIDYVQLNPVLPAPFPWMVGKDDNAHPAGDGGGPNTTFVQEAGTNPLPGVPNSPETNQQADDDYYFAGEYTTAIPGNLTFYGDYTPLGSVLLNEEAAERAFAGSDNDLRYHFNLPSTLQPSDQVLVSFDALSLDNSGGDPHYGVEVYFNGVLVLPEVVIYPLDFDTDFRTAPFTLESVGAQIGPGQDNIVHLKGINKSAEGGGNWLGIDYVALDPAPQPVFPLQVGMDDDGWPLGDGGGPNASFVQENGAFNDLPGNPGNAELAQQADDDYYFAGIYNDVLDVFQFYTPVGVVPRNEEAAERAFTVSDTELRYHFNLPETLLPADELFVTFDVFNLQDPDAVVTDPHFGIEIYFNGVQIMQEMVIRPADLGVPHTTPAFTLEQVNAEVGPGPDNILTLRGIEKSFEGGGNWMGFDYVRIHGEEAATMEFTATTLADGAITLDWSGAGTLEWAPAVGGPWTPVSPAPAPPYTENVVAGENRFYRLTSP